jgi:hypothetical protein
MISKASDGNTGSNSYVINISDDEKTVLMKMKTLDGESVSRSPKTALCSRFHDALTWSTVNSSLVVTWTARRNANGTARFVAEGKWIRENAGVTLTCTGVFSRQ